MPYATLFLNCSAVLPNSSYRALQNFWGAELQSIQTVLLDFTLHSTGHLFYTVVYFAHFQSFKRYERATSRKSNTQFITQHSPLAMSLRNTDCWSRISGHQVSPLHKNAQLTSIFNRTKKNPFSSTYFGCASLLWSIISVYSSQYVTQLPVFF